MKHPSIYITTPIYYVNDCPHLGHFYTTVAADVLARFHRLLGYHVKFLTGTDEHGTKVAQVALSKNQSNQAYVDEVSEKFRAMTVYADATPDVFIRTTEPRHYKAAQALWKTLETRGQIYLSTYAGWYAIRDEAFYEESELIAGPNNQLCAPTGAPVEWIEEPCYFFRLSHWQQPLLDYYQAHPEAIAPESRLNETLSFIRSGLTDLAVSRSKVAWGIPIEGSNHVMYVWIDALTNYITALGYPCLTDPDFLAFWPTSLHLVGKDILRFHTVYWPAFLMASGIAPAHRVFAHGWWTRDGQKMSKSLGNAIDPRGLVDQYGSDAVRYFLLRHVRFGQDGDFSETLFVQKIHQELADGLGNLAYRVLSFIHRHQGGVIPELHELGIRETTLYNLAHDQFQTLCQFMKEQDIFHYLEGIYQMIQRGNQYMNQLAPWILIKVPDNEESTRQMKSGLHVLVHLLRDIGLLLWPVMPNACTSLLTQVGFHEVLQGSLSRIGSPLRVGQALPVPTPLFKKEE